MANKEKLHQILSSLWKNDNSVGKIYYNQALQDVQTIIDLQEEPANGNFEAEVKKLWEEINTGHNYSIVDSYNQFYGLCMEIAEWLIAKAVDVTINIPCPKLDGSYTQLVDSKEALPFGDKLKVLVINKAEL